MDHKNECGQDDRCGNPAAIKPSMYVSKVGDRKFRAMRERWVGVLFLHHNFAPE